MTADRVNSLFVVSLPRSLSSTIYHAARNSLGLQEPTWTSDGEFLNGDRIVLIPGPNDSLSVKYTVESTERALFSKITAFASQVIQPDGYAYKDVVQPFVVSKLLRSKHYPTLKIRRNIADVAYSMLEHSWHYPARLFPNVTPIDGAVIQGLARAQVAMDLIPGVEVDFDQLILDETTLDAALRSLYGNATCPRKSRYIDRHFRKQRAVIMERRNTEKYQEIRSLVANAQRHARRWFPT